MYEMSHILSMTKYISLVHYLQVVCSFSSQQARFVFFAFWLDWLQ